MLCFLHLTANSHYVSRLHFARRTELAVHRPPRPRGCWALETCGLS